MERQELIDQIVSRVKEKLGRDVTADEVAAALGGGTPASCASCAEGSGCPENSMCCKGSAADEGKPGLLILTQEHGTVCHELLESKKLKSHFHTECALLDEYKVDLDRDEVVILFDLTVDAMVKIASGFGDTPYTSLAVKALLGGKKIYILKDQIELYCYRETAPANYYQMLKDKLDLLVRSGLTICERDQIEDCILGNKAVCAATGTEEKCTCCGEDDGNACAGDEPAKQEKEVTLKKHVITERDIIEAGREKVTCIHLRQNSIVTDLAKDAAAKRRIRLAID